MLWSESVWLLCESIFHETLELPFIKEMAAGTLDKDRFTGYLAQDAIYLKEYAEALSFLADSMENEEDRERFMRMVEDTMTAEKQLHAMLGERFEPKLDGQMSALTAEYTAHLRTYIEEGTATGLAAILPCDWIYNEVGHKILEIANLEDNPYREWMEAYDNAEYTENVSKMINLTDKMADEADENTRERMTEAFLKSAIFEKRFWECAYHND